MFGLFKSVISSVLTPIFLLILLILATHILIIERQKLVPISVEPSISQRGVGVSFAKPIPLGEWQPYYGGGQGVDSVISQADTSLRVSTGGDGGWYGARADIKTGFSLDRQAISFSVYVEDWAVVDRLLVMFATNDGFTDYYGINLKNYFAIPANQEWIEIVLERGALEVIEGNPNWTDVTDIGVRVVPQPSISTRVWFDEFNVVADKALHPTISFTFDDGFKSVVDASEAMSTYGYTGTAFVIPRLLDTEGYLTQDDVDALHSSGWSIGGHSDLKLTTLTSSDLDTELASVYRYLADNKYDGREHFAYPNGAYNLSVKSQVLEYFTSARTIDGFSQPIEYAYPQNINAITISSSTPITEVIFKVDKAVAEDSWLILVWHDFSLSPDEDVEYNIEDFKKLLVYLNKLGVEVKNYSEIYSKFYLEYN